MKKTLDLTPKQAQFVNIFIEKGLQQSAKQCAIDAGYGENVATVIASKLQNPKYYPHVVQEIERRRAELNRRYSISYKSHIQKLAELRDNAEAAGNFAGARWLQNVLGHEYRVTTIPKTVYHGSHIDSTIIPLREGLVMLNGARVKEENIPEFMKKWDKLWILDEDIVEQETVVPSICTKWMALNVFSINPELVVCDPDQYTIREKLNQVGIETIGVKLPHGRYLLGGHHCTTLDTIRE